MNKPISVWVNLKKSTNKMSTSWVENKQYVCSDKPQVGWTEYKLVTITKKKTTTHKGDIND